MQVRVRMLPLFLCAILFVDLGPALPDFLFDGVELSGPLAPAQPTWVKTGGPPGGAENHIRMRPDNFNIQSVTDTNAGGNMRVDGGNSWSRANTGITARLRLFGDAIPPVQSAGCLDVSKTRGGHITDVVIGPRDRKSTRLPRVRITCL